MWAEKWTIMQEASIMENITFYKNSPFFQAAFG